MKIVTVAGTRATSGEPPRSTAYYYADLERLKRKNGPEPEEPRQIPDELSEYVESNEVINDGAVKEVPPLRDRQWSLPEYSTPENARKLPEETYSTAGTFPMPEPKEKEPLLAELEVVGRLPLTQLETTPGVRRSRSWYLCCPNVADEEISRESSWRYSSLRPVTAPPLPGQNGIHMVTTSSGRAEDLSTLRAERDALARALAAERQRAATAARAHDARLAELHGVIAELVRRRAADKQATAIPEEEVSDECESTTQPAGELDNDADLSRTEQNDTSSALSPAELPAAEHEPEHERAREQDDTTDTSTQEIHVRVEKPVSELPSSANTDHCETSFNMSERDSEICVSTARCCQHARGHAAGVPGMLPPSPGRCESRQAKIASRVRLRRTEESQSSQIITDESWWSEAAERLARGLCAQADLREALVAAAGDDVEDSLEPAGSASVSLWRARCVRLAADCRVLDVALARAVDTAHRLSSACAMQESSCVAVCGALRAADRALEAYDVLLALAETAARPRDDPERCAAEAVAIRLLRRLSRAPVWGEPLLSPGPWHDHHASPSGEEESWSPALESQLRRHAARLKRETVALRHARPPPRLYSPHDMDDEEETSCVDSNAADMEAAVLVQEVLAAREARLASRLAANTHSHKSESGRRERHWLHSQPETDL